MQKADLSEFYYRWLGIPLREQPPDHYRLLGLALFEHSPEVIESAADRQMAHVRSQANGPHSAASQKVLNSLSSAKLCLLDERLKAQYDAALRSQLALAQAPTGVAPVAQADSIPVRPAGPGRRSKAPSEPRPPPAKPVPQTLIWGAVVVISLLFFFMSISHVARLAFTARNDEHDQVASAQPAAPAKNEEPESAPVERELKSPANASIRPPKLTPAETSAPPVVPEPEVQKAEEPAIPSSAIAPFNTEQAKAHQAAWANRLDRQVVETNSIGMKLALIPPGEFQMGTSQAEVDKLLADLGGQAAFDHFKTESPSHKVRITKSFFIGAHEVTVAQFRAFVEAASYKTEAETNGKGGYGIKDGWRPGLDFNWRSQGEYTPAENHPVVNLSWNDATAFCAWLSRLEQRTYRLPTEAEWEFACRAGTESAWICGDSKERLDQYAWTAENSGGRLQPVSVKLPNSFGLYDVHGNAFEWCQDWLGVFEAKIAIDPIGPASGSDRVLKSGSFSDAVENNRSAVRGKLPQSFPFLHSGLRVVCEINKHDPQPEQAIPDGPPGEVRRLLGHTQAISSLAFLPDGRLLSGSADGTVQLWHVVTGKEEIQIDAQPPHGGSVRGVAVSPDGRTALSCGGTAIAYWNLETGQEIRRLNGHTELVTSVAYCPDGHHAFSGSLDGTARLWEVDTGEEIYVFKHEPTDIWSVAVLPDGHRGLTGIGGTAARLWDLDKGTEITRLPAAGIVRVSFSPDGKRCLCGSAFADVKLFDLPNGAELAQLAVPGDAFCTPVFSPDGRLAVWGTESRIVRVLDLDTRVHLCEFRQPNVRVDTATFPQAVCFSADGKLLASGGDDGTIYLWRLPKPGASQVVPAAPSSATTDGTAANAPAIHTIEIELHTNGKGKLVLGNRQNAGDKDEAAGVRLLQKLPNLQEADVYQLDDGRYWIVHDFKRISGEPLWVDRRKIAVDGRSLVFQQFVENGRRESAMNYPRGLRLPLKLKFVLDGVPGGTTNLRLHASAGTLSLDLSGPSDSGFSLGWHPALKEQQPARSLIRDKQPANERKEWDFEVPAFKGYKKMIGAAVVQSYENEQSALLRVPKMEVTAKLAGMIGIVVDFSSGRAVITRAFIGFPGGRAGLAPGDVLTSVNGRTVANMDAWTEVTSEMDIGDEFALQVLKEGKRRRVKVVAE